MLPLQVSGEEEDAKRVGKDNKVDERCDYRKLGVGLDHVGVLDYPEDTPEDHVRDGGEHEPSIDSEVRTVEPAIDEVERSYEDEGVRDCLDRIIGLFVSYGIDVIFVEEITNHP